MAPENQSRGRSWPLVIAMSLAAFVVWSALSLLTFQDGPDDPQLIVSLLSK
jgi:hypothetical protein